MVHMQVRNCLTELNHEYKPIPELAESWDSSPDASKWVFKLRKGVEFHSGKTMDAEDVVFSINYHRGEQSKSSGKGLVDPVTDIKIDDKYTVVFELEGGNADFPFIMSDYHLTIVPAGTTNFEDGMGTGAYKLVSREPGVRALTKKNPNYWYFASELPQPEYDPDKAKYHLKKAKKLDHTFKRHVADAAFAGAVDSVVLFEENAVKAGINIEVVRESEDGTGISFG